MPIDSPGAGDLHVIDLVCRDETVPNDLFVVLALGASEQRPPFVDVKVDMASEVDRPGQEFSGGNHDRSSFLSRLVNRLLNRFGVQRDAVANRAEVGNIECQRSEDQRGNHSSHGDSLAEVQ